MKFQWRKWYRVELFVRDDRPVQRGLRKATEIFRVFRMSKGKLRTFKFLNNWLSYAGAINLSVIVLRQLQSSLRANCTMLFCNEEKPRILVDASSKVHSIPRDTLFECCSNIRENYCRMRWLGSWTMYVAMMTEGGRGRRERMRERMREVSYGGEKPSSSSLGKYAVERSAFTLYRGKNYHRFLLPPRFFSLNLRYLDSQLLH